MKIWFFLFGQTYKATSEKFEDTKGVIRSHKPDRQYNGGYMSARHATPDLDISSWSTDFFFLNLHDSIS